MEREIKSCYRHERRRKKTKRKIKKMWSDAIISNMKTTGVCEDNVRDFVKWRFMVMLGHG